MHSAHAPTAAANGRADASALRTRAWCPSCGCGPAVVFSAVRSAAADATAPPLVCLDCCPKVAPLPPGTSTALWRAYTALRRAERARDHEIAEALPSAPGK